jgi:arylformamidase
MTIEEGMTTYPAPWHPYVEITQLARHGIEGRETRKLVLGTHTGTHIDAPRHFVPNGSTVEKIRLYQMCGNATLLDLSKVEKRTCVTLDDMKDIVGDRSVDRVVLRFDGDDCLGTRSYYDDQPWISTEAARWLVDNGCMLLGMDVAMPDCPDDKSMSVHKILLEAGVVIVEYLVNLSALGTNEFELFVAPLKIKGGDGAPARCFAIIRD